VGSAGEFWGGLGGNMVWEWSGWLVGRLLEAAELELCRTPTGWIGGVGAGGG